MESILETKASTILEFFAGLRGTLSVTFEEGTWAAWLYDLLKPHVAKLLVCNPRKNALLKEGNKSDESMPASWPSCYAAIISSRSTTARRGAHAARAGAQLSDHRQRSVPSDESAESAVSQLGDPLCRPRRLLHPPSSEWLEKMPEAGIRRRAERLYQQLDMLQHLRQQARRELLAESRKHAITAKLRQIPSLGPIRSALAVALIQTPHRFRTKRQLWAYSGLAWRPGPAGNITTSTANCGGRKKQLSIRGLNKDHNHDLKGLFKGAATMASVRPGPFQEFYQRSLAKGIKPTMARLTLARKIAAITLTLWKKGENFDAEKLKSQAA